MALQRVYQQYQIRLTRQEDGNWQVTGYWDMRADKNNKIEWSLDGAPKYFPTRKEAMEFIANQDGIPD